MSVINFEQVNTPRETFNVITIAHLNAQSQQQNTRKKCEICSGEIIQRKMWGNFQRWGYYPGSLGELFRGNCPGGNCLGGNFIRGNCPEAVVQAEII